MQTNSVVEQNQTLNGPKDLALYKPFTYLLKVKTKTDEKVWKSAVYCGRKSTVGMICGKAEKVGLKTHLLGFPQITNKLASRQLLSARLVFFLLYFLLSPKYRNISVQSRLQAPLLAAIALSSLRAVVSIR